MYRMNDNKQLFDPWDYVSLKQRTILDQSWSGLFREEILLQLPVQEIKACFSKTMGRPTKELYTVLGALVLQQPHDLTDDAYDKRTGVKRLRIRCFGAVRFAATLKAAGINIFRAAAVRNVVNYAEKEGRKDHSTQLGPWKQIACQKAEYSRISGIDFAS